MVKIADPTKEYIKDLEKNDWENSNYLMTGFPHFDRLTEGLQAGVVFLASYYSVGKTSLMLQIGLQMVQSYENLHWIIFSLDDPKAFIIHRMVANLSGLKQNMIARPHSIKEPAQLAKRKETYEKLQSLSKQLSIYDSCNDMDKVGPGNSIESMRSRINEVSSLVLEKNPKSKFLITIDSFSNLISITERGLAQDPIAKVEYLSPRVKELVQLSNNGHDLLPVVLSSIHLRKGTRVPKMDDIKGAIGTAYDSSMSLLAYSDVSNREEEAKIYFHRPDMKEKCPVVMLRIGKTKMGERRGVSWYEYYHDCGRFNEVSEDDRRIHEWRDGLR